MGRHNNQKAKVKAKRKQQNAKQSESKKSNTDVMEKTESHARGLTLKEYLRVGKQIEICSLTVTCFVVGVLLEFGVLVFLSARWSSALAMTFILFSYLLLLIIAKELKKWDIHGIRDSAWAAFILFLMQKGIEDSPKWLFIFLFVGEILCIYSIINGLIRLSNELIEHGILCILFSRILEVKKLSVDLFVNEEGAISAKISKKTDKEKQE